jgi:hypothetical protein
MKATEDSVIVVDLGHLTGPGRFLFLGRHEKLPTSNVVII